jgi:DNA (cytosine-5)-methyltransferase 3A
MANTKGLRCLSVYDGISCGQQALKELGINVSEYYACEIDPYAIAITQKNFPNTIQLGDVFGVDFSKLGHFDLVIGGSPCFIAGHLVLTKNGYKPIEEISVGDLVYTHNKNWKAVTKTGQEEKAILEVKAQGIIPSNTTAEHPFYIRNMKRVWNNSNRQYERTFSEPSWVEAQNLTKESFIAIPILQDVAKNEYNLTSDQCWLLGRYLADGHYFKRKRKSRKNSFHYGMILSIGKDKVQEVQERLKDRRYTLHSHTNSTFRFTFSDMQLVELITNLGLGKGAKNKKIPRPIMDLPTELLKDFLEGYISGDGHYHVDSDRYTACTISKELAHSFQLAIAKVYRTACSVSTYMRSPTTVIEGRTVNQSRGYTMTFCKHPTKQQNYYEDGAFIWMPVHKVSNLPKQMVYNISVADDESYTVNNVVVHNCTHWSIAKKGRETTSEGVGFELFMRFVHAIRETNATHFLYENNFSIHQDIKDAITEQLGVEHIMIDSASVSAQRRRRCYWSNLPTQGQPDNLNIVLKDVLEQDVDPKYNVSPTSLDKYLKNGKPKGFKTVDERAVTLTASSYKGYGNDGCTVVKANSPIRLGDIGTTAQAHRVYSPEGKSVNLTAQGGGQGAKTGLYHTTIKLGEVGNGGQGNRVYSEEGKSVTLTTSGGGQGHHTGLYQTKDTVRRLTPVECERLQTLPDGFTETGIFNGVEKSISDSQRYRCCGNGWTVAVIKHLMKDLNNANFR